MKDATIDQKLYSDYQAFKKYQAPDLKHKHIKRYDRVFWYPAKCCREMAVLEIGCGTGNFLQYLHFKGVTKITGVDHDTTVENFIHPSVRPHFKAIDIFDYLKDRPPEQKFDRIVLFDVLEHFDHHDGYNLLFQLAQILANDGQIVVQVPNMASPWGAQHQFGDLTHKAAYTPNSMRQLALSSGLNCFSCYPQYRGSRSRNILDAMLHSLLSKVLVDAPEIWSANFLAILQRTKV